MTIAGTDASGWIITTAVGSGEQGFAGDGDLAAQATLDNPFDLAFDSISYEPGVGVRMTFRGRPDYEYRIKYGTSLDALTGSLLGDPVNTGDSTYMFECIDIAAKNIGERYYQLVETPIAH